MSKTNQCMLVGNLGADPVERARTEKTGAIVSFTVAENVQVFEKETKSFKTVHTNWFPVTAFGTTAERVKKHLKKGDKVVVQGRMKMAKFTDKAGEERTGFEIVADDVAVYQLLPSANADASSHGQHGSFNEEALPF